MYAGARDQTPLLIFPLCLLDQEKLNHFGANATRQVIEKKKERKHSGVDVAGLVIVGKKKKRKYMHTTGMTSFGAATGYVPTLGPLPLTVMTLQVDLITRSCEYEGATINNNKKLSFFAPS